MDEKENNNQIDEYTKALLDSKTKNENASNEEKKTLSQEEKLAAEGRLENALDQLRKQRGQKTIRQEEKEYRRKHSLDIMDFTTQAIQYDSDDNSLKAIQKELDQKQNRDRHTITKTRMIRVDKEDRPLSRKRKKEEDLSLTDTIIRKGKSGQVKLQRLHRTLTDPDDVEIHGVLSEKEKKEFRFKSHMITVLACACVLALLLTGYAYYSFVYKPEHTITPKMQETYNTLRDYADEWDMSSDTEKIELLKYKSKYNQLLDSQKEEINSYFKEQTGKTLNKLFSELSSQNKQSKTDSLNRLRDFINQWDNYTDDQKEMILNYVDVYQSLSTSDQQSIDDLCEQVTGSNFNSLVEEEKTSANSYQDEIDTLKNQLSTYQAYGEELETYQQDPEYYGFTSESLKTSIENNNETIQSIKKKISEYQEKEKANSN